MAEAYDCVGLTELFVPPTKTGPFGTVCKLLYQTLHQVVCLLPYFSDILGLSVVNDESVMKPKVDQIIASFS